MRKQFHPSPEGITPACESASTWDVKYIQLYGSINIGLDHLFVPVQKYCSSIYKPRILCYLLSLYHVLFLVFTFVVFTFVVFVSHRQYIAYSINYERFIYIYIYIAFFLYIHEIREMLSTLKGGVVCLVRWFVCLPYSTFIAWYIQG